MHKKNIQNLIYLFTSLKSNPQKGTEQCDCVCTTDFDCHSSVPIHCDDYCLQHHNSQFDAVSQSIPQPISEPIPQPIPQPILQPILQPIPQPILLDDENDQNLNFINHL